MMEGGPGGAKEISFFDPQPWRFRGGKEVFAGTAICSSREREKKGQKRREKVEKVKAKLGRPGLRADGWRWERERKGEREREREREREDPFVIEKEPRGG